MDSIDKIDSYYDSCELRFALYELLKLSDLRNRYLNEKEPWKSGKTDALNYCLEIIRLLAIYFEPILPQSSQKVFTFLNTDNKKVEVNTSAKAINKPEILFRKLEKREKTQI